MLILQFIMLSLHSWFTTVVKGCLSATFGTEYSSWCVLFRGMQAGQAASDQYCPRSILVSPPPAWLHSTRTRAIRSFIALAWGGHDLVHNVRIVPPNPRGDENTEKYCPRPEGPRAIFFRIVTSSWIGGYNTDIKYYPANFQACHKSEYCHGPSVTGPRRKRCLNIDHGYVPQAIRVWPPI